MQVLHMSADDRFNYKKNNNIIIAIISFVQLHKNVLINMFFLFPFIFFRKYYLLLLCNQGYLIVFIIYFHISFRRNYAFVWRGPNKTQNPCNKSKFFELALKYLQF